MTVTDILKNPIVERAYKTFIEVTAAQCAVLGSGQVSYKAIDGAVLSLGSAVLSVLWNSAEKAIVRRKDAKLTALSNAITAAAQAIIDQQAAAQKYLELPPPDNAA